MAAFRSSVVYLPPAAADRDPSIRETLEHQVGALLAAHRARHPEAAELLRGHGVGKGSDDAILDAPLDLETARKVIAAEHALGDWDTAMRRGDTLVDRVFESAVDAVVDGELEALRALLAAHPDLVTRRSVFGHAALLIHYVAANGVENTRQHSPPNAIAILQALLDAGADPDAGCCLYGSNDATTLGLLVSSDRQGATLQADLVEVLCRGGAKVEGLQGDGSPLWTAITWGYRRSAERLVQCGARVDNVITAAAMGDLTQVKSYFGSDGRLLPGLQIRGASCFTHGRPFDPSHLLEYALITAAGQGRAEVVEFLLAKGADPSFREPIYKNNALDAASYSHPAAGFPDGHPEVRRVLQGP